ncbi:S66 peptidase family protein [Agrilactobacillus fermenti]|nr:hypothetical protein [Agrilactobacillus fermenti]
MFYQLGLQTFYGPNFLNDLAELASQPLPYTWQTLQHYKQNPARTVIESSTIWYEERTDFSRQAIGTPRPQHQEQRGYEVLRGSGITTGRLLGGCLDSFYDILTTTRYPDEAQVCAKYQLFPNTATWQDKILFIETSETHPQPRLYQKMLEKLADQGVFAAIRGIIVGKPQNEIFYEAYKQILLTVTAPYQMPIFYNVNFGHGYPRTALPYGALLQMDCDQKTLTIMEPFFANA